MIVNGHLFKYCSTTLYYIVVKSQLLLSFLWLKLSRDKKLLDDER